MKKILITGGAGFLGSHLCSSLVNEGNDVICMDNLFTSSIKNIEHLFSKKNFQFIRQDITFPVYLEVDEIYNLACPASPLHYQKDPIQTMKVNVIGSINMLGLAKRTNAKIFQSSTSEIYGNPNTKSQDENYFGNVNPIGIRSCYDEGKRAAESLFFDYHRMHQTKIKVARIFNTYGPNMAIDDGRVISNFIVQCLKGKDLTIYGKGNQTRSFCYVDDLIIGIKKLMNTKKSFTGPLNLGNDYELRVIDIAKLIIKLTNSKSKIRYFKLPQDDPIRRRPNLKKAKLAINWKPRISLEEGLKKTIEYFSSIL